MPDRWPALLKTEQAAEYLGVSVSTLVRLRGSEVIKSVLLRDSVRYRRSDLDKLIEQLPEETGRFKGKQHNG